jgi:hypothetical protein
MSLNENLHRGQTVKLLEGTTGFIKGPITNFGFLMWEIQLDNGKIQTEAIYRFDVIEEPPTNPPELDAYDELLSLFQIRVITKLPNSEQSYKGKVKTHNYINIQNQSTTGKL